MDIKSRLKRLTGNTGGSLIYVLVLMMVLVIVCISVATAARASAAHVLRQRGYNQATVISTSMHESIMLALLAEPTMICHITCLDYAADDCKPGCVSCLPACTPVETLGSQMAKIIDASVPDTSTIFGSGSIDLDVNALDIGLNDAINSGMVSLERVTLRWLNARITGPFDGGGPKPASFTRADDPLPPPYSPDFCEPPMVCLNPLQCMLSHNLACGVNVVYEYESGPGHFRTPRRQEIEAYLVVEVAVIVEDRVGTTTTTRTITTNALYIFTADKNDDPDRTLHHRRATWQTPDDIKNLPAWIRDFNNSHVCPETGFVDYVAMTSYTPHDSVVTTRRFQTVPCICIPCGGSTMQIIDFGWRLENYGRVD